MSTTLLAAAEPAQPFDYDAAAAAYRVRSVSTASRLVGAATDAAPRTHRALTATGAERLARVLAARLAQR